MMKKAVLAAIVASAFSCGVQAFDRFGVAYSAADIQGYNFDGVGISLARDWNDTFSTESRITYFTAEEWGAEATDLQFGFYAELGHTFDAADITIRPYAILGYESNSVEVKALGDKEDKKESGYGYGIGARFELTRKFNLAFEWKTSEPFDRDYDFLAIDMCNVRATYSF